MNNWGTEFRVGVFTLLGVAVTIFAIFVLSPDLFDTEEKATYYTVLKDASGIMPKTHVKTNGVTVGKVETVNLDTNATRVTFEIESAIKVPKGSTVEIRTVGFLGDKFLEIRRAADTGEYIAPGELIPRADSVELNEVISIVGNIAQDIKKVTENLSKVLGGERGEKALTNIVDNIEALTDDAKGILHENRESVKTLVANLKEFSTSLNDVLNQENKDRIDRIIARFDKSMEDVEGATKNINLISQKVERGEGTLGRLINDDETIESLEGAIKDLRNVLAPVSQLQVGVDYHGEVRRDESTQHYFNVVFRTRPNHFYILGFTDRENDIITRKTETTTTNGITEETETKKEERALRFNLQFGRRWYWAGVRFGLFESTGGLATDLYLFRDRLKFTIEAFDFAEKDSTIRQTAHIKSYLSALFFNHIYAMVGVDDPTRYKEGTTTVDKKLNYFFGAGLTFNDQDLKALFGVAALAAP